MTDGAQIIETPQQRFVQFLPFQHILMRRDLKQNELFLPGGLGSGKTLFAVRWHHDRCLLNPGYKSWWLAPDHNLARFVGLVTYIEYLESLGWIEDVHFRAFRSAGEMRIEYIGIKHTVFFKTANGKLVGENISHLTVDETGDCEEQGVKDAVARVRSGRFIQKLFVGAPQGLNHFSRRATIPDAKTAGHLGQIKFNEHKLVLHFHTYWNKYLLPTPEDYIRNNILENFNFDPQLIKAWCFGMFVPLFDKAVYKFGEKNILRGSKQKGKNPQIPEIGLSLDFNVDRMAYSAYQTYNRKNYCVAEAPAGTVNTDDAMDAFISDFPPDRFRHCNIVVDGDATGHNGNTAGFETDYDVVFRRLRPHYRSVNIRSPDHNGPLRSSILATNRALCENSATGREIQLFVDENCHQVIDGLYSTVYDGKDIKKTGGMKDAPTDFSDSVRYRANAEYPLLYDPFLKRRGVSIGQNANN